MALSVDANNDWMKALRTLEPYKPNQGLRVRYGTLAALLILVLMAAYSWSRTFADQSEFQRLLAPVGFGLAGAWVAFRSIHYPRFADFLIATEAEVVKVSWPSWQQVKISTIVVLINVLVLTVFLFVSDVFWQVVLGPNVLGILRIGGLLGNSSGM